MGKLSDSKIKSLKPKEKPYKVSDGEGLIIEVKPTGRKIFRIRYRFEGREKTYTIGHYPTYSLREARETTRQVKKLLSEGIDPNEHKKEAKLQKELETKKIFDNIAREFFEFKKDEVSKIHLKKQQGRYRNYISPTLSNKNIDDITKTDIIELLKSVKDIQTPTTRNTDKRETARRVYILLSQIYKFAIHHDYTDKNTPSNIDINQVIPKPKEQHFKAITDLKELRVLYRAIQEDYKGYDTIKNALIFLSLTALRPINIRNLEWEWVDIDNSLIVYPPEATKIKKEYRLPLTLKLRELLFKQQINAKNSKYVFPSPLNKNKKISDATLNIAHKRLGFNDHNAHGWRSSFSTICYERQKEHGFSFEVIETQLMHSIGNKVTRAYMRSDFLEERRELLEWWEKTLEE